MPNPEPAQGESFPVSGQDPTAVERDARSQTSSAGPVYAGFWRRFAAFLIDEILLGAVALIFSTPLYLSGSSGSGNSGLEIAVLSNRIFSFLLHWLYFALMESSSRQATLGKMAIGIMVQDYEGRRISFLRGTGRYFGKFLSAFILGLGFLMAGFTRRKQALHDMLAETLVVMKKGGAA